MPAANATLTTEHEMKITERNGETEEKRERRGRDIQQIVKNLAIARRQH